MAQLVITDLSFFELELPKSGEISGGASLPGLPVLPQVAQYLSNYSNYLPYVGTVTPSPSPSPSSTYITTTIISFGTNKPPKVNQTLSVTGGSSTNATSTGVDG